MKKIRLVVAVVPNTGGRSNALEIYGDVWDVPAVRRAYRSTWERGIVLSFSEDDEFLSGINHDRTKDTLMVSEVQGDRSRWRVRSVVFDRLLRVPPFGRTQITGYLINPYTIFIPWESIPEEEP